MPKLGPEDCERARRRLAVACEAIEEALGRTLVTCQARIEELVDEIHRLRRARAKGKRTP